MGSSIYTSPGLYFDTLISGTGCDSIVQTRVTSSNHVSTSQNIKLCNDEMYFYNGIWVGRGSSYYDTLISVSGCDSIHQLNFTRFNGSYEVNNHILCFGDTLFVNRNAYANSGVYIDVIANIYGCDSIIESHVSVLPLLVEKIDTTVCKGTLAFGRVWNTDTVVETHLRYHNFSCDSFVSVLKVSVKVTEGLKIISDSMYCENSEITIEAEGGSGWFFWSEDGINNCYTCPSISLNPTGDNKNVWVMSGNCEGDTIVATRTIYVASHPDVNVLLSDSIVYAGEDVLIELVSKTDSLANWYYNSKQICISCASASFSPKESGMIIAEVINDYGCVNYDTTYLTYDGSCPFESIEIPNIMTMNDDGLNDKFMIKNPQNLDINTIRIFDRWGEMLFETNNPDFIWDGTYKVVS